MSPEKKEAYVKIDPKADIHKVNEYGFTYMGANFKVHSTTMYMDHVIYPNGMRMILVVGSKALETSFTLLLQIFNQYSYIGLQAIEVNPKQRLYCDLHYEKFEYVKMTHDFKLQTPINKKYNQGNYLMEFINRMTVRSGRQSNKPSHLFIVRPRCATPDCLENHGEIRILSIGEAFSEYLIDLFDTLLAKKAFERSLLNDLIHDFVGKSDAVQFVFSVAPGNEQEMMGLMVQAGVFL